MSAAQYRVVLQLVLEQPLAEVAHPAVGEWSEARDAGHAELETVLDYPAFTRLAEALGFAPTTGHLVDGACAVTLRAATFPGAASATLRFDPGLRAEHESRLRDGQ
jgi:hypothetical protein